MIVLLFAMIIFFILALAGLVDIVGIIELIIKTIFKK